MLWTTKLTNNNLTEDKFGHTFQRNVKQYNKYSAALASHKKNPGSATQEELDVLKEEIDKINKKLCSNIQRYLNNPDAIEKNKERMKTFHKKPGTTAPASTEPVKADPPAAAHEPAPAKVDPPKPAATAEPAKVNPPKPAAPAKKNGSSVAAAIGWSVFAFVVGIGTGIVLKRKG